LQATVAQQRKQIEILTAQFKEQANPKSERPAGTEQGSTANSLE